MTKLKKISLITALILVILLGLLCRPSFSIVHADDGDYTGYNNYTYDSYHVDIVVKEDNSYDITETITMTYGPKTEGVHQGWARAIPYRYQFNYTDKNGKKYRYMVNAEVTLGEVTEFYDSYKEDGLFVIEMKQDGVYVNGQTKEYVIKYNFSVGYDFINTQDMFYFNIIGSDFPVKVNNVTFSITMPKPFDSGDLKFYKGLYGESDEFAGYTVSGNVISSSAPINLKANEALTINLDLPEGYYNTPIAKIYNTFQLVLPIVAGVMLLIIAISLMLLQNRDTPTPVVEFYAPDDLSPADCKYILDGKVTSLDVSSIIVLWASKGYVKIILDQNKKPTDIARVKDMPENFSEDEKRIWNALFSEDDVVSLDINMKVSESMQTTAKLVRERYNCGESSRFSKKSVSFVHVMSVASTIVPFIFIVLLGIFHGFGAIIGPIISTIALFAVVNIIAERINNSYISKTRSKKDTSILTICLLSLVPLIPTIFTYLSYSANVIDRAYTLSWYFAVAGVIYGLMLGKLFALNKKTFDLYGRVAGFKNAIELADEAQLKALVKEDPEYFYKVIPYAHVFGIYEKFVNKFSGLAMPINEDVGDTFTTILILDNLRYRSRYYAYKSMSSSVGSSFGGHGGFGGGFSGGGHGGGGGRGL